MVTALHPTRRAVFLDRDGVINRAVVCGGKPYPFASPEDLEVLPGVEQVVEALREACVVVIVVTNQPDVGAGKQRRKAVDAMHAMLRQELAIDDIKVCYHTVADGCGCRKPAPGMLLDAAREHGMDLNRSFLVGDCWRDVSAGNAAGCMTCFIDREYAEELREPADHTHANLPEAARHILTIAGGEWVDFVE